MTTHHTTADTSAVKRAVLFVRSNQNRLGSREAAKRFAEIQRIAAKVTALRLDATIVREYTEYTGLIDVGRRNELLRMLGDLLIHPVDYLITQDWTRLVGVENAEDLKLVQQTAQESGTKIVTVTGLLDELPAESLLHDLLSAFKHGDQEWAQQRSAA